MQKILTLAVVGAAIIGLTTAFASNTINLTVQNLGVGEENITSPIENASVDFNIAKITDNNGTTDPADDFFRNVINACSFHSNENLPAGSTIICKLTDKAKPGKDFGNAVAEGRLGPISYTRSDTVFVPITSSGLAFPNANDVQNIHDVKIVVLGPAPR